MNSSQTGPKKHNRYGIEVAADRYFSVNGPAMDRLPGWGAKRESDGLEIHLHPALSFEVHYRLPKWVAIYAFNGAETRGAFDEVEAGWVVPSRWSRRNPRATTRSTTRALRSGAWR
ncbi:MAG: hypothetical protein AAFW46_16610, partial [Pseudomonadota bacterium]